jgi:cytidylate kinase
MRVEVLERDRIDSERTVAPLRPAEDAMVINTDHLDLQGVVGRIVGHVRGE